LLEKNRDELGMHFLPSSYLFFQLLEKKKVFHNILLVFFFLQVLKENNVRKEELKARALALKNLGRIFQVDCLL